MRSRRFYVVVSCSQIGLFLGYLFLLMPEVMSDDVTLPPQRVVMFGVGLAFGILAWCPLMMALPPTPEKLTKLTSTDIVGATSGWLGYAAFMFLVAVDNGVDRPGNPGSWLGAAVGGMTVGMMVTTAALSALFWLTRSDHDQPPVRTAAKEQHAYQG